MTTCRRPCPRRSIGAILLAAVALPVRAQDTTRISETPSGATSQGFATVPSISDEGRFVAFYTDAADLVSPDTNASVDVFVRDRATGVIELVSKSTSGDSAAGFSSHPAISGDGRRVAFVSSATDMGPVDTNLTNDVYVYDRETGVMALGSVDSSGVQTNSSCIYAHLSADGRYLSFSTSADNLVPGDTNGTYDVFVRDLETGVTELVSRSSAGALGDGPSLASALSADGRYVAFDSAASNFAAPDTNAEYDVFVRDRVLGTTERMSLLSGTIELTDRSQFPDISGDGRYVTFTTRAPLGPLDQNDEWDVVVRDRLAPGSALELISYSNLCGCHPGNGGSVSPSISADGKYVAYHTLATNIMTGVTDTNGTFDVYRVDRTLGGLQSAKTHISVALSGAAGNGPSTQVALSADGSQVAFQSQASDLVPGDTSMVDVFVRNEGPPFPELYCAGKVNSLGCTPSLSFEGVPSVSSAGTFKVRGHDFIPGAIGIFLYGANGRSNLNFHGGKLCVKAPVVRWLPPKAAQTTGPAPCTGFLSRNFNKRIQSGADVALTAGRVVNAQWLQRDQADPAGFGDALSNGIEFTIAP